MAIRQGNVCGDRIMKEFLTSKEYRLTCISPVHIGSGQSLRKCDYIYDAKKRRAGFINESAWQQMLVRRNLLDKFLKVMGNPRELQGFSLLDWLRLQRVPETELQACVKRYANTAGMVNVDAKTLNDVHLCTATPEGELYIPGSSIKGALRTGLLYSMLDVDKKLKAAYKQKMLYVMKNPDRRKMLNELDRLTKALEKDIFVKGDIHNKERFDRKLLAGLVVGDAHLLRPVEPVLVQKLDVTTKNRNGGMGENSISLTRECIPAGTQLKLRISIDRQLLGMLGVEEVEDVISCTGVYLTRGLELQKKAFGKEYGNLFEEAQEADFFLGGGTGFLQKSLWFSLFDDDKMAMDMLKKYLDEKFVKFDKRVRGKVPMHNHQAVDKLIAPRTLKISRVNGQRQLLGLCRLEEM